MNSLVKELIQHLLEDATQTVALFPGKFKPPHAGHFDVASQLINRADKVIVIISKNPKDNITAQQSKAIWELYKEQLGKKLEIIISENPTPIDDVYDYVKNNPNDKVIAVYGKGEKSRYGSLINNPNVEIFDGGTIENEAGKSLNASDLRPMMAAGEDISQYLPPEINPQTYINILKKSIEEGCGCMHTQQPNDFKSALASLTKYMLNKGLNITPLPKVKIISNDTQNAQNILGKTAYYNPEDNSVTLYTLNRHPKDVLRSFSHEMIHRIQNNEGRLDNVNTTNTNEDSNLHELEKEAYLNGNIIFRNWEDSIKNV